MTNPIFERVSVRKFKDEPVSREKIEELLKAAMQAPSAGNQQPWFFAVVENAELRKKLSECSPYAIPAADAPVVFVLLCDTKKLIFQENWQMDLSAAATSLLLEANSLGLGGVWLGIAPLEERMTKVAEVLGLPENLVPFCLIPCGVPASKPAFEPRFDAAKVQYFA
jgi:nitroreductase